MAGHGQGLRAQSAMEYLMTYAWAILIIAVVMVVLYELNAFNPITYAPKATPGACQTVKSAAGINLEGQCNNELPRFALDMSGTSYASEQSGFQFMNNNTQQFTMSIWLDPSSPNGVVVDELAMQYSGGWGWHDSWIELVNGNAYIRVWNLPCVYIGAVATGQWSNIIMTYDGNTYSGYVDGRLGGSGTGARSVPGGSYQMYYSLGNADTTSCGSGAQYQGMLADFQLYNTSLTASSVQSLYGQGIGAVPITPLYIAGWWPLNGNTKDYSGNADPIQTNGNISFIGAWYGGYSQP